MASNISAAYYNYYQALCIFQPSEANQIVYGYSASINQPNLKIMGNDGNNYYYKGTRIHFTNTNQQNIPTIQSGNTPILIIEHDVLTNSISRVYSKLYVVILLQNFIAPNNDFTALFDSQAKNSNVNLNGMIHSKNANFFLDSKTNSAVMVFEQPIQMDTTFLNSISATSGNGNLLFNSNNNYSTIEVHQSLESWLQCSVVSTDDEQQVAMKSVPVTEDVGASNQRSMIILIVIVGFFILTNVTLPRVYYWMLCKFRKECPTDATDMKDKSVINKTIGAFFPFFGGLIGFMFVLLSIFSIGGNGDLKDNMSGPFLITGISIFLYTIYCSIIINGFRTNDSQIEQIYSEFAKTNQGEQEQQ